MTTRKNTALKVGNQKKQKPKETQSFRPTKEHADEIWQFLEQQRILRGSPSINNTIQCVILDYKNNTIIYEPKNKK